MPPDDLTAALQPVKDRAGVFAKLDPPRPSGSAVVNAASASAADVPVLVAALEAVLQLTDEWAREGEGPIWRLPDDEAGARQAGSEHATALREAITRTLKGE